MFLKLGLMKFLQKFPLQPPTHFSSSQHLFSPFFTDMFWLLGVLILIYHVNKNPNWHVLPSIPARAVGAPHHGVLPGNWDLQGHRYSCIVSLKSVSYPNIPIQYIKFLKQTLTPPSPLLRTIIDQTNKDQIKSRSICTKNPENVGPSQSTNNV